MSIEGDIPTFPTLPTLKTHHSKLTLLKTSFEFLEFFQLSLFILRFIIWVSLAIGIPSFPANPDLV